MQLSLICAMATNRVIGRNNALPWHLSEDLKYFKCTTMGKCIIMGRKTWESIGRLLPGRTHIVVTTNPDYHAEGIHVVHSIGEAIEFARTRCAEDGNDEALVIGGAALYAAAMPLADRFYLTRVHALVEGDTSLAEFDEHNWAEVSRSDYESDSNNPYNYSICVLERVRD